MERLLVPLYVLNIAVDIKLVYQLTAPLTLHWHTNVHGMDGLLHHLASVQTQSFISDVMHNVIKQMTNNLVISLTAIIMLDKSRKCNLLKT